VYHAAQPRQAAALSLTQLRLHGHRNIGLIEVEKTAGFRLLKSRRINLTWQLTPSGPVTSLLIDSQDQKRAGE
jgi:hypothetical protein